MNDLKEKLIIELSDAVVEMDEDRTVKISGEIIKEELDAYEAIDRGLASGMERAGKFFEEEEYFIPELLMCADAMYAGLDILKPHIRRKEEKEKLKIVIGVVEGDTHDIGKNLVKIMLETSGFDMIDLGRDVPPSKFVETAIETGADFIAMSTLMTTTMDAMGAVIDLLKKDNIREKFKIIVGGGPVSQGFADKIGADGYSSNAAECVRLVRNLSGITVRDR